jgi:hypothetical protein
MSVALQKMAGLDEGQEFVLIMRTYLAYLRAITAFCEDKTDRSEEAAFLIKRFERDAVEAFMKAGDL